MEATFNPTISTAYTAQKKENTSPVKRFLNWCAGQEENRFAWLAVALAAHGCALTPITMFAIILSGNFIFLWVLALVAMGSALVTNLAAMPTKITIPVFLLSVAIDVAIIVSSLVIGFDISGTYI